MRFDQPFQVRDTSFRGAAAWVNLGRFGGGASGLRRLPALIVLGLLWLLFLFAYLGIQAALPFVVGEVPPFFLIILAFLLIGVIILLAGADKRWRLVAFIGFFLIMAGQIPYFFGATRLNTRVLEILISLGLMAFVALDSLALRRRTWPPVSVLLLLVLQLLCLVASWLMAEQVTNYRATRDVILMHATGLALFSAAYIYVRRWDHVSSYARIMTLGAFFFSLLGIVEYFGGESYYRLFLTAFPHLAERVYYALVHHRVFGTFDNQVFFGSWLAMFVTIPLALRSSEKIPRKRFFWSVCIASIWLAIFFTGSRGPFVGAVGGVVLYSWLAGRIKKALFVNICVALVTVIVVFYGVRIAKILPDNNLILRFVDPAAAVRSGGSALATLKDVRVEAWKDAIAEWRYNWLLGIGPGEWVQRRMKIFEQGQVSTVSSFSPYVQYLVETGLVGVITLGAVLAFVAYLNIKGLRRIRPGDKRDLLAACAVACLVVHLVSLTDVGYGVNRLFYFFWMTQGVVLKGVRLTLEEQQRVVGEEKIRPRSLLRSRTYPVRPVAPGYTPGA